MAAEVIGPQRWSRDSFGSASFLLIGPSALGQVLSSDSSVFPTTSGCSSCLGYVKGKRGIDDFIVI